MNGNTALRWKPEEYKATGADVINIIAGWLVPYILTDINIKRGGKVLEGGVGSGKWSAAFSVLGYETFALDNSLEMLKQAEKNFPELNITFIQKDVQDYPLFKDNGIDLLFSEGLVEHFLDDEVRKNVLHNFYKAVQKGGYIALIVPFESTEEDEIAYSDNMLKEGLEAVGFHVLNLYHISFLSGDGATKRKMVGGNAQK